MVNDVPVRIRRAIHLNDLVLLKRIIKNNPKSLQNPDFDDNGNTSLHLAAKLGLLEIAEFLVESGHENNGISKNGDWNTPLHLAAETSELVGALLAVRFPRCIPWKNRDGADALMLASRTPVLPLLLPTLLSLSPPPRTTSLEPTSSPSAPSQSHVHPLLSATDAQGNTALHYASAYGQLKSVRALLASGANPGARNAWSWQPVSYSLTVQAEVYFRGLVGDRGGEGAVKRRGEAEGGRPGTAAGRGSAEEKTAPGGMDSRMGLRLVTSDEDPMGKDEIGRRRAGSAE